MNAPLWRCAPAWQGRSDPEDGRRALRMHHCIQPQAARAVAGFACDIGVRRNHGRAGAAEGPTALRRALANLAAPETFAFTDLGDVAPDTDDLEAAQSAMTGLLAARLPQHDRIVLFGGGHETALASYCGLRDAFPHQRIGILNLDAHLDLRALGAAGGTSGTPFFQIRNLDPARFDYVCLGVARESNTEALIARAKDWDVGVITDEALMADPGAGETLIDALVARNDLMYLTMCLDVLPAAQAPGVSAPAVRGLPLAIVERIIGHVLGHAARGAVALKLCDIVELSPPHDIAAITARTAAYLARRLLID
ncbi:MAG: formimidoylglutamase [Caulobacterales bacterium]